MSPPLDSGSSFFNKKFKNWWRQNQNEPGHEDKDGSDGLCVDLKNDVECLFGKIGDVYQEYEVRDVLDSIFKYFYTSEIDLEIVDFEEWLCLVRVADYFAMDTLIQILSNESTDIRTYVFDLKDFELFWLIFEFYVIKFVLIFTN